jgi:metacaspase-1
MTPRRTRVLPVAALAVAVVVATGARPPASDGPPRVIRPTDAFETSAEGTKRALIVAISDYGTPPNHPETGEPLRPYRTLNAKNDIPLVRGALEQQGFEDIRLLQDADADVEGIRAALRRLVRDTDEGDVVVVHYSGHGHRITNDNPDVDDEVDGYDEVLVPYGAPDDFYEGYDGSLHFRDDELGTFVLDLRRRAGVSGNVTVFLDACYTGTGTRGGPELPARGSENPLGPPARASAPVAVAGDGTGMEESRGARTRGGPEELAPFVVFSAASQRQVAYETWDVDGKTKVGSLSYAIARTLPGLTPGTTNRTLFAEITGALSGKVMQTPQMEGAADAQVFSNRLSQQFPYVVVESVESNAAVLAGGSLVGVNVGTLLAVHALGTNVPEPSTEIATLRVVEATATMSVAEVTGGTLSAENVGAWSFVTQRTYGDLGLRVALDRSLRAGDREGLATRLSETGIIDIVEDGPDVVIEDRNGLPIARTAPGHVELASGAVDVVRAVEDFARNRYLRRLTFDAADIEVALDFAPVELETDRLGRSTGCGPADWDVTTHGSSSLGGEQWALSPGDVYRIQARNVGRRRAFVAVLDLQPRGAISVLRPRDDEAPSSYELEVDGVMDLGCYQLDDEEGLEVLKLFATRAPQDFRAMFETRGTRAGNRVNLSALEAVLASTYTDTRSSEVGQPEGAATTRFITIRVTPN